MSGYEAEIYSDSALDMQERAETKAKKDTYALIRDSVTGYATITHENEHIDLHRKSCNYALLPVWIYDFRYQGETYQFHVNGQTGKVIGKTPVAHRKVLGYSATVFALSLAAGFLLRTLMMFL